MTIIEIREVKRTWKLLRNINPSIVADAFYSKLFLEHPRLRSMFPKDMDEQYDKLITMLSKIVARLDNLENIQQEVVDMGERHKSYGVVPKHYDMVGEALLWTLEKGLGDDWNDEAAKA